MKKQYRAITFVWLIALAFVGVMRADGIMITGYICPPPQRILAATGAQKPTVGGVPFLTSGCIDWSNKDGLIKLPKFYTKETLRIAVTKPDDFLLQTVSGPNVSHLELAKGNAAQCYRVSKKQDKEKEWYYTAEKEATPANNMLDATDLVILVSDPSAIFINTQRNFFATEGKQFAIPQRMITLLWDAPVDVQQFTRFYEQPNISRTYDKGDGKEKAPVAQYAATA